MIREAESWLPSDVWRQNTADACSCPERNRYRYPWRKCSLQLTLTGHAKASSPVKSVGRFAGKFALETACRATWQASSGDSSSSGLVASAVRRSRFSCGSVGDVADSDLAWWWSPCGRSRKGREGGKRGHAMEYTSPGKGSCRTAD